MIVKLINTRIQLITVLTILCFSSNAQTLDREYIDNWIKNTFLNSVIDSSTLYVLNGIPIENNLLNKKLSKFDRTDLIVIDFIDKETIDSLRIFQPRKGIVILNTKGNQKTELIKKNLTLAKEKFSKREIKLQDINTKFGEPVLVVNGVQVFHNECYEVINSIKEKEIIGINIIGRPVSEEIYGRNAINGLIIIFKN
jgi:hypothetical protein